MPAKTKCKCRAARRHRDCSYCGTGYRPDYVCGICRADGVDGKTIPGTSAVVCSLHKSRPRA